MHLLSSLTEVPESEWPQVETNERRIKVWVSHNFLVQAFLEHHDSGILRLSVNRVKITKSGAWKDRITWDELQAIKREVGYGDYYAVEVYPRDRDIVNVANMRHLWVMPEPLPLGWFNND